MIWICTLKRSRQCVIRFCNVCNFKYNKTAKNVDSILLCILCDFHVISITYTRVNLSGCRYRQSVMAHCVFQIWSVLLRPESCFTSLWSMETFGQAKCAGQAKICWPSRIVAKLLSSSRMCCIQSVCYLINLCLLGCLLFSFFWCFVCNL